ncbi:acyl-CoA dehydrogenase family protein [[Mycobacterium] burgundiense]|uniref:Acyl-CoA dehydrogenase family protein n=1 Tax=[Mycobacterium] burgundiense TaxID=3064286 RepID=A0ABM9LI84_9MYCO|nr:acyl-CoA dehydrogenase family protein [Mycolicibacterium sp. MU0053]CAJ1499489.1 acyl-CoA dehydrogenase family protein [Mycolicibacterium sp. MU0053]
MLLELNSDQRLWRDTVRDALAKECPASLVRAIAEGQEQGTSAPLWKSYVDNGWTELTEAEETVELGLLVEELGRATDPTPYLATLTQFTPLAPGAADPKLAGAAVYDGVIAARVADGWELDGTARHVLDGDRADRIAVATPAGVFVVGSEQFSARPVPVFDPVLHVAEVTFDRVRVATGDRVIAAHPDHVARAKDVALTGLALTMVGACQRVLDMVLEHVGSRQQFGVLIGSFQAVQHKAADMHVAIERARALSYFAALTIAADDPRRRLAAHMAKAAAGECQSLVFKHGIQLFGAMGFTWENDVQFALKRAKAFELLLGGAAEHRAVVADMALAEV